MDPDCLMFYSTVFGHDLSEMTNWKPSNIDDVILILARDSVTLSRADNSGESNAYGYCTEFR